MHRSEADELPGLTSPNPENKLFVGGAPPGTDENTLQQVRAQGAQHLATFFCFGCLASLRSAFVGSSPRAFHSLMRCFSIEISACLPLCTWHGHKHAVNAVM